MKRTTKNIVVILIFFLIQQVFCGDFTLTINYLDGEKSKDSYSSSESFSINNYNAAYSVKYSGHNEKNKFEKEKNCTFSEQNINSIKETILSNRINISDSIFSKDSKTKSFERYFNISVEFLLDDVKTTIKMNGDTDELENTELYKKAVFLISFVRTMIQDC